MRAVCLVASCAASVLLATAAPAAAAALETVGDGRVVELDLSYEVTLDGVVARVTARQELRGDADELEAVYTFALPANAAVVGLTVTPPGGVPARGAPVDAVAATSSAPDRDTVAMAPDRGLIRRLGAADEGGDVAYEARVYPVGTAGATVVEITWVAPLDYVDGRLALRIPGRGPSTDLATRVTGTVTVTPPAGVKQARDLAIDGTTIAARPGKKAWAFTAGEGDVAIDVRPGLRRAIATFSTARVDDDGGAVALAVLRPRAAEAPSRFDQVVFVVDGSTSAAGDAAGRGAMATLVEAIDAGVRDDATVHAIAFDRAATALLDAPATAVAARDRLGDAIRGLTAHPGSDLAAALGGLRGVVDAGATLVVIVTDGVLPSDVTADRLAAALDALPGTVTVSAVLVAPDGLPLPDPRTGPLAELCRGTGGHAVAVRDAEAEARAATIAAEVGAAADWELLGVDAGKAELSLSLPDAIPAGGGVVAFGWYRGAKPSEVTVTTSGGSLALARKKLPGVAALAGAVAPPASDGSSGAERAVARRARAIGAVDARTALVAVDPGDALAVDRLALAARGGTFARIPPPRETWVDPAPAAQVEAVVHRGAQEVMDTSVRIRADLLSAQLVPAARQCARAAADDGGAGTGRVALEIEIARGEVIAARASSATASGPLVDCLRDAAYALQVPSYTLTDGPDVIHLIRYPVELAASSVSVDDGDGLDPIDTGIDVDDPLGGLHAR